MMNSLIWSALTFAILLASTTAESADFDAPVEFADGERVVFLGDTFFERAQRYGWLETAMQLQFPERSITVRNLGWSGDTVFAESRGIFDPPAKGYSRMLEQINGLRPTVIMLNYGGNESFNGSDYLETFTRQYEKLLDDLAPTGAKLILVSPVPLFRTAPPIPDPTPQNATRGRFVRAVAHLARSRSLRFINLWRHLTELPDSLAIHTGISADGIHLNEVGYSIVSALFARELFGKTAPEPLRIDFKPAADSTQSNLAVSHDRIQLTLHQASAQNRSLLSPLQIASLTKGPWTIYINERAHLEGLGKDDFGTDSLIARYGIPTPGGHRELRNTIIRKNQMYFHSWRPQNVTYLFLFRKHEQGQNAREVDEFEPIIKDLEATILKQKKQTEETTIEIVRSPAS